MHAWKPGTVTCFYPIYYPDFSAFCSIQPLYYKLPSGKLLDQITKSFCLLSPANDIYFYFETLPTARSVGRKALGVGITRHILESAAGTEMWRSLIWKLQWQFLSVPKNKRWGGEELQQDKGDALENPNLTTGEGKVQIFTAREELSAWINQQWVP